MLARRGRDWVSWTETLLLTALAIGLGMWLAPDDPLQVGSFPWPLLASLLVAVRYGFVKGLASAGMLVAAALLLRERGLEAYAQMPATWIIGVLVTSMLVGEFRDQWERRLQRLYMANEYRQYRLDEFTRAHQILRISHDRLEQRVAGSDQSLRSSLLLLRERLRELKSEGDALVSLARPILMLLGQYGSLGVVGLYRVSEQQQLVAKPLAVLGDMEQLDPNDQMVRMCVDKGDLISVREGFLQSSESSSFSRLQACVPLIDTEGKLLAIVAIQQMPFFMFNDRTLSLLALLAGHVADLLRSDAAALQLSDVDQQSFSQHLQRALIDVEQHGLSASLCLFEITETSEDLQRLFTDSQRGLDLQLWLRNRRGRDCLLVLMPLTSAEGASGYLKRVQYLLSERFGQSRSLEDLGVEVLLYEVGTVSRREGLRNFLFQECGLNDRQVAV